MSRANTRYGAAESSAVAAPVATPQIDNAALQYLFTCCAGDRALFFEASRFISPQMFLGGEEVLSLLWGAMVHCHQAYRALPFEAVAFVLRDRLQVTGLPLGPEWYDYLFRADANGLVWSVLNTPMPAAAVEHGREILRRFLYERAIYQPLLRGVTQSFDGLVPDVSGLVSSLHEQHNLFRAIQQIPEVEVAPPRGSVLAPASTYNLTGVPFVDGPLLGQRQGDCNGLIGVTQAGKTTLGLYMATSMAQSVYAQHRDAGTRPRLIVFVTYEEAAKKLRPRIWSSGFKIARQKLELMGNDWSVLSTPGTVQEYERRFTSGDALSESERYDAGRVCVNACLSLLDMSGSEDFPTAGTGGMAEIVSALDRLSYQRGQEIHTVFIDYAGLAVRRWLGSKASDPGRVREELKSFGQQGRVSISERFGCTTWVLHQIRGDAGKFSPGKLMHHTDAQETKDFAENMAVCGCLGVPDTQTGCRRLNWSKVRYRPNQQVPPHTLRINDVLATVDDVTSEYTLDDRGGSFLARTATPGIGGLDGLARRPDARGD